MTRTTPPGRTRALLLLASLSLAAAACASEGPLVEPPAIAAAATPAQTREAILRALIENRWTIESDQPGAIVARIAQRDWNAIVAVDYAERVTVRYVSSENLRYHDSWGTASVEKGTPVIHNGYNKRVRRLADRIAMELEIVRATNAPPPVAAPSPGESRPLR